jgi:hypothetical protein
VIVRSQWNAPQGAPVIEHASGQRRTLLRKEDFDAEYDPLDAVE